MKNSKETKGQIMTKTTTEDDQYLATTEAGNLGDYSELENVIEEIDDYGTTINYLPVWPTDYYVATLTNGRFQAVAEGESLGNFENLVNAIDEINDYLVFTIM